MKKILLSVAILSVLGSAAFAADTISAEPPAGFVWTGGYVGLQAGYGWGKSHHFTETIPDSTDKFSIDGALGGVTLGYNYQINNWVLGAETDFSAAALHGKDPDGAANWGCEATGCETKVEWFGTVRARAGIAFDRTLPYVTGGLAYGHVNGYIEGDPEYSNSETHLGWTVGAGVEHALTDAITVKAEYLYVDLGKIKIEDFGLPYGQGYADAKFSTVRLGFNYKF